MGLKNLGIFWHQLSVLSVVIVKGSMSYPVKGSTLPISVHTFVSNPYSIIIVHGTKQIQLNLIHIIESMPMTCFYILLDGNTYQNVL